MPDSSAAQPGSPSEPERSPVFYVVSIKKLVIMTIMTMGLYQTYWFYRNWKLYSAATNKSLIVFARAAIPVLFVYSLCSKVDERIRESGRSFKCSPLAMLVCYAIPALMSFGMMAGDPGAGGYPFAVHAWMLAFGMALQLYVLIRIQRAINFYEEDVNGQSNSSFTELNALWNVIGLLYWLFNILIFWVG